VRNRLRSPGCRSAGAAASELRLDEDDDELPDDDPDADDELDDDEDEDDDVEDDAPDDDDPVDDEGAVELAPDDEDVRAVGDVGFSLAQSVLARPTTVRAVPPESFSRKVRRDSSRSDSLMKPLSVGESHRRSPTPTI